MSKRTASEVLVEDQLPNKVSKVFVHGDSSTSVQSASVDYFSQLPVAILKYKIEPLLMPVSSVLCLPHRVSPRDTTCIYSTEKISTCSKQVRRDTLLVLLSKELSQVLNKPDPNKILTQHYLQILHWIESWCEKRKNLLVNKPERAYKKVGKEKLVGFSFMKEVGKLAELGLNSPPLWPNHYDFLSNPHHVAGRDQAWRQFVQMEPAIYDAAVAKFRFDMDCLHMAKETGCGATGWSEVTEWNGTTGNSVSPYEAVLQLYLGRNLRCADDYFMAMMWSLTCHFGAKAAWITASSLLWFSEYSHKLFLLSGMASMFAHIAQVMIDKDPTDLKQVKVAEAELAVRLGENEDSGVFSIVRYGLWHVLEIIDRAKAQVSAQTPTL